MFLIQSPDGLKPVECGGSEEQDAKELSEAFLKWTLLLNREENAAF